MTEGSQEEKKIFVDEDWKAQAQKEKEILIEQERVEHEKKEKPQPSLPEATFSELVYILWSRASYALGARNEEDKEKEIEIDWHMAKFNIDMLGILEDKCKGNLTIEEEKLLKSTLDELRKAFVEISNLTSKG